MSRASRSGVAITTGRVGIHGMKHLTPNIPEIVAEVRELFERYEAALEAKDVAVLSSR